MQYRTFRTQAGFSLEAAMVAKGEKLVLSHMALGDGGGSSYEPDSSQTSLKNEITRFRLNDLSQKKDDPASWFAEGICPEDQGGFTIREAGLFTEDGTLYAIASLPEQYRPSAADGIIGQFVLRMNFKSANTQNITLNLDQNIITATKSWVEKKLKTIEKTFSSMTSSQVLPVPDWASRIEIIAVGGGGGGAGCDPNRGRKSGGGGASGAMAWGVYNVSPNVVLSVLIGAGGSGGAVGESGTQGGTTSVSSADGTVLLSGGGGGASIWRSDSACAGGERALAVGGTILNCASNGGSDGQFGSYVFVGNGAPGPLGSGVSRAVPGNTGLSPQGYGQGGGGIFATAGSASPGSSGIVLYRFLP